LRDRLTPFPHRYAMVTLACAGQPHFVPSLLEAPRADGRPNYSFETALAARRLLGTRHRLYFLMGVDAFLDLPHWKEYRRLLNGLDFIVVSRPGFDALAIRRIIPRDLLAGGSSRWSGAIRLRRTTVHILRGVDSPVASREIREAIHAGRRVTGLVPALVEQYILKEGLYRSRRSGKL
jgi:nicotinate-nucleotide adenylyltransferase